MHWMDRDDGGRAAAQAYWNALSKLRIAWRELFGEDLHAPGSRAKEAYENALAEVSVRLRRHHEDEAALRRALDVAPTEDIGAVLLASADLDERTPNSIKGAMMRTALRMAPDGMARMPLRTFLRAVLDELFDDGSTRRPNVGPNRHWPRLLQYLRELEEETDWSPDGRGVRLVNAGGRGPVARFPHDPRSLGIVVDPDHL